ncbi:MAG TPA: hypothetical protein VIX59_11885 [Candidatus Binataceae bacterium]
MKDMGEMGSDMGIFGKEPSPGREEARLLEELAEIVGRNQGLVERLKRHAGIVMKGNIKSGVERLAEKEAAHLKALNAILSDRNVWSRLPEPPAREGANNWERLSLDLEVLGALVTALTRVSVEWEAVDQNVAAKLAAIASEDGELENDLRKLAIKCDPQALD